MTHKRSRVYFMSLRVQRIALLTLEYLRTP
jgi:hypothetical protein